MSLTAGFCTLITENIQSGPPSQNPIPEGLERFSLIKPLPMKLEYYVDHFLYQLDLEDKILSSAYLVLEPILQFISQNNLHKIVFTALEISYKAHTDKPVKNSSLEKIGVLKHNELVELEKVLLYIIDWNLQYCRTEEIEELLQEKGIKREEDKWSYADEDDETDFTECGDNDSFSELSAFF